MNVVLGIALLILGIGYPMGAVVWLNGRMGRQPPLSPRRLGLILALNGILPLSPIFWGLGLLVPGLSTSLVVRGVAIVATIAAIVLLIMLRWFAPALSEQSRVGSADRNASNGG